MKNLFNQLRSGTENFVRTVYKSRVYQKYPAKHAQLPKELFQIVLRNCLGDGSLYTTKTKGSKLKLQYGRVHKDYQLHLHAKYKGWGGYAHSLITLNLLTFIFLVLLAVLTSRMFQKVIASVQLLIRHSTLFTKCLWGLLDLAPRVLKKLIKLG